MKTLSAGLLLGAALLPLSAAAEGPYVGASGLYADHVSYDDVDGSWGGKIYAGYRFAPYPLFVEASYLDTGDADVDPGYYDSDRLKLSFRGYTVGAGLFFPFTPEGSGFYVRGAYYAGDAKLKTPDDPGSSHIKDSTSGASVAVGADWKFNDWLGLRLEYENLFEPEDFADDENIGLFSFGLFLDFPTQGGAARRRY